MGGRGRTESIMKSLAMRPDPTLSEKPFGAGMAWVVSVAGWFLCVLDYFFVFLFLVLHGRGMAQQCEPVCFVFLLWVLHG